MPLSIGCPSRRESRCKARCGGWAFYAAEGSRQRQQVLPERRITPTPPRPGAVAMAAMVGWDADMVGSYRELGERYYSKGFLKSLIFELAIDIK